MNEWQPIETAPKKIGRHLLLFGDGLNFTRCVFVGLWWNIDEDTSNLEWVQVGNEEPTSPSHWMPLPEPPGTADERP